YGHLAWDSHEHAVSLLDALALERAVDAGWTPTRTTAKPPPTNVPDAPRRRSRRVVDARWTSRPRSVASADSGGVDPDPRIALDDLREDVVAVWAAEHDAGATVEVNGADRSGCATAGTSPTAVVISTANSSCSGPATALPSSISSSISAAGW